MMNELGDNAVYVERLLPAAEHSPDVAHCFDYDQCAIEQARLLSDRKRP
jgi:hypothetical protein